MLEAPVPGTTLVTGAGLVAGAPVLLALMDGHTRGGTVGVHEAAILARLAERAARGRVRGRRPAALIIAFDTGGVRVEEGPIALAATSGVGVALAQLTLSGLPTAAVISGPRGCFGAPSVMAALPDRIIMTSGAHWGLTGPRILGGLGNGIAPEQNALDATSALSRLTNADAHVLVPDDVEAVRMQVRAFVRDRDGTAGRVRAVRALPARVARSVGCLAGLRERFQAALPSPHPDTTPRRRRDLLRYSFRGQWTPTGPIERQGLVHAALGTLGGRPALGVIVGPEQVRGGGVGIEEAAAITRMVQLATEQAGPERAAIFVFLFCQGHAVDATQERFGLTRALAECLRTMVAARLLGHPIISILGGGTYGAAYLSLAAPSHRILALRGTSVAPMSPQVLRAFQVLRGRQTGDEAAGQLAELIPGVRIVDSVIRLPRVVKDELAVVRADIESADAAR
jgi:malonate decarboxylase beta subunit